MLSYQHIYHAGNMADLHKHLWLITVLDYLNKKDKPYCWLDTHSGRGLYDLTSTEANKTEEYKTGIEALYEKLMTVAETESPRPLQLYQKILKNAPHNTPQQIKTYPGSATIAANTLRRTDRLIACDLHKQEFAHLQNALLEQKNGTLHQQSGYEVLKALFPPLEKRGGALIDPSYEIKSEYEECAKAVIKAYKKWPQGIYMIWYPIMKQGYHEQLLQPLKALNLPEEDFLIDEMGFSGLYHNMIGSGMAIINPPYTSQETIKSTLKSLDNLLN